MSTVLRDSDVEHRGAAILDPLTGMLNRAALMNRTGEIEGQSVLTGEPVAVILLDLDRFKLVNDSRGHATGDTVLREVAYRLRKQLRAYDLLYRLGGEEFVVLLLGGTPAATTRRPRSCARRSRTSRSSASTSPSRSASPRRHAARRSCGTTSSTAPTPRSTAPRPTAATASP